MATSLRPEGELFLVGINDAFAYATTLPAGYAAGKTFTALWGTTEVVPTVAGDVVTVAIPSPLTEKVAELDFVLAEVGGNRLWQLRMCVTDSPGVHTSDLTFTIVTGDISISLAVVAAAGVGVAQGGSTGQALVKTSGADYATGWATVPTSSDITTEAEARADGDASRQLTSAKGQANGYASLDGAGLVPDAQIPSGITRDSELAAAVAAAVSALVAGAPGALDTLNELAAAVNDDASFAATVTTALGARPTLTAADARYAPIIIDGGTA